MNHDKIKRIEKIPKDDTRFLNNISRSDIKINEIIDALQEEEPAEKPAPELSLDETIEKLGDIKFVDLTNGFYVYKDNKMAFGPTPTEAVKNLLKEMGK